MDKSLHIVGWRILSYKKKEKKGEIEKVNFWFILTVEPKRTDKLCQRLIKITRKKTGADPKFES